jgi:hypothetical protein
MIKAMKSDRKNLNYYSMLMTNGVDYISDWNEMMAVAYHYRPREVYFINKKIEFAWMVLDSSDNLVQWEQTDVDFDELQGLENTGNARIMAAPYGFNINPYKGNYALVSWTLHPDGRYFADEDGFGMTDDEEVKVYGIINGLCEVIIPFQPKLERVKEQFERYQTNDGTPNMAVITGIGIHGDEDLFIQNKDFAFTPSKAHEMLVNFEKSFNVTIITTCQDQCHEQAGSASVIHLLSEEPEKSLVRQAVETVRNADVIILLGCRATLQPLRNVLQYVRPSSRLYLCYYNDGEGKLPHLHNIVKAFAVSTFTTPEDGIDTVINHLRMFPLEDNRITSDTI